MKAARISLKKKCRKIADDFAIDLPASWSLQLNLMKMCRKKR
jgi:hypothetical protein